MVLATLLITLPVSLRAQTYTAFSAGNGQAKNFPQPQFPGRVVVADFDGDGDADILSQTGGNGSALTYSRCDANANFTTVAIGDPISPFRNVAAGFPNLTAFNDYVADFDHDGDIDLWLTTNLGTGSYFRNDGGVFTGVATAGVFPSIGSQLRVTIADFSGDGFPDILFQDGFPTVGAYHYLKNNGVQGAPLAFTEIPLASSPFAGLTFPTHQGGNVFAADFDKDGNIDIWFGGDIDDPTVANRKGWFFKNNGSSFAAASNSAFPELSDIGDAVLGDFDSDGDVDILYQTGAPGTPYNVALNTSTGGNVNYNIVNTSASIFAGFTFYDDNTFVVADFDGDTDMDIWQPRNNIDGRFYQQIAEPPYITSSTPADDAVNVDPTGNITITFNKAVNKGAGNIHIIRTSDNATIQTIDVSSGSVTTAGAAPATTWTIDPPSNLAYGVGYSILFDPATFRLPAPSNIAFLGIDDIVTFNFTTRTNTAPTVVNLNGDMVSYQENATATVLDAANNATVTDGDSPDFIGGNVTVTITTNKETGDKLAVGNIGLITISGSNINYNGNLIGTFTGDGSAAPLVVSFTTVNATPAAATALLRAITFVHTTENPTANTRTITFTVNDGDGGTSTVASVSCAVTAVNDAPVNTVPTGYIFNEDTQLTLTGIQFTDVDQDGAVVSSDFFVPNGSGTFQTTGAGVTVAPYTDGTNTGITIAGTYAALNAFMLAGNVKFTPAVNFNGNTLSISVRNQDGGHTGTGGVQTDLDLIPLTINAINDAPVNNVPISIPVTEDAATALAGISFSDIDAGNAPVKVTLSVPSGTLAATTGSGVTVGGTATALTLTGSITDINAFIAASNVTFLTTVGSDVILTVLISDEGNTGTGGALTDSDPVTLSVTAVNDAPALAIVTTARAAQEDVATAVSDIVISDEDAGSGNVKLTLAASSGTLSATVIAGVAVTGNNTGTLVLTGTLTAINAGITGGNISYKTAQDDILPVAITVTIDDQGNTGTGGAKTATATLNYTITAVNDAPVNHLPVNISVTEDQVSALTGISFSDVDAGSAAVKVTLSVPSGALAATAGAGVTVGGTATALTLTGSIAAINAFIAASNVTFLTTVGSDVVLTVLISDEGNTGTGGALTDSDPVTLRVAAVNDAPSLAIVTTARTAQEDIAKVVNDIVISDEDAGAGAVKLTLSASSGTLSASAIAGVTATGNGSGTLVLTGTLTAINAGISGGIVSYTTAQDDVQAVTVTVTVDDQGNTGTGGSKTATATLNYTIAAVNDAPVNNVPATINVAEDAVTALTGIGFSDVDAGTAAVTVTLRVPTGTLAATSSGGVTVGGTSTALILTGSIANINTFIGGGNVTFTTADPGNVTLTVSINDNGNTGTGGSLTDTDLVTLVVAAANDAPTLAIVTTARTAQEDIAKVVDDIVISDEDAGTGAVKLTLSASSGRLSASAIAGVTVTGNGSGTLVLTGTLTAINAGISGGIVSYTTAQDDVQAVTVTVTVDDQGNTGTGGSKTATATLNYTIAAVNDAPVNNVPATIQVTEEQASVLTGISFSDVDAGTGVVTVTLRVPTGTLAATSGSGVTVGGTSTALTLSGTIGTINTFISGGKVTFTTANAGNVVLTVSINDNGNTGTGGSLTDTDPVTLVVDEVNDAPVLTIAPASLSGNEDNAVQINNISIADEDINAGTGLLHLQSSGGAFFATPQAGITIVSGNNTNDIQISGTLAGLNSYLLAGKVAFTPAANFNGTITITVTFDDQGNTGTGGAKQDQKTFTININAINDTPSITAGATINVDEDTETAISGISFADVDAGTGVVKATFAAAGTLTAADGGGVTVNGSGTNTVVLNGTITAINSFISAGSLKYTPVVNATGNVNLSVNINDNGYTGADPGGPSPTSEEATTTVVLTLVAMNDAPVIAGTGPIAVTEDVSKAISGMTLSDEDAGSGSVTMTFTLPAASGNLTATSGGGVTVTGNGTATISLLGTVANINTFIAGNNITYMPANHLNGDVILTLTATDNGHTGAGGALQAVPVPVTLQIAAVNDVPSISSNPIPFNVQEDVPTAIRPLAFSDVDAGTGIVKVSFIVAAGGGTFAANSGSGVTVNNSGSATLTLEGTLTDINTFIAAGGVTYTTPLNSTVTPRSLTVRIDDNGNTGSGGNLFAQLVFNANITAVNDAPVITIPAAQTVDMNNALVLNGADKISISDVDLNGGVLKITLTATNGSLTLGNTSGLSFSTGDGLGDVTMTFTGSLSSVNTALNGLTFIPPANYYGAATIKVTADDQGNTGAGGAQTDEKILSINVQPTFPIITAVSSTAGNGTYKLGDVIPVTVTFNMPVLVTGTPQVQLETGATDRNADYVSGAGSSTLTFSYTVQSGDQSTDLDYTATTALQLNGGSIKSAAGLNAALTLAAPGAAGSLGANKALVIDGIVPTIASVAVPANGTYITGQVLQFTVNTSEVVTVNTAGGSPTLTLQIGSSNVQAVYVPGAPATAMQFRYTVVSGDLDTDGINVSGLQLNGATIQDAAGNNLHLALQNVAPTTAVLVDAVAPAVTSVDIPANKLWKAGEVLNFVVHYSEAVTIAGGTPFISVTMGSSIKNFALSAGAGTNTLTFSYTIAAGDLDRDGIAAATNISLNTATIKDAAGNNATLVLTGMGATTGVLVDAVPPVITTNQVFSVNENSAAGTTVGAVDANDPGSSGTLQQWTITTNVDADGDGVPAFIMDPASNVIKVNDAGDLNYEVNSSLTISVRVSDGVNQSAVQTVKINLNDMPEPPLDIQLSNLLVAENNLLNITVGTLTATADEPGTTFTYTLVAGTGSNDNSSFSIAGDKLTGLKVFNFEEQSSYRIRVRATTQHGEYLEKTFVISIRDVNEAPTIDVVTDKSYCASGNDERIAFTTVTAGPEAGQTVTLTASNDNNGLFSSFTIAGNELRFRFVAGASGVANVTVTAKDNGGTANGGVDQIQRTFRIAVSSINTPVITSDKGLKVSKGDVVRLTATGGVSYVWDPNEDIQHNPNQAVLVVRPKANATYRVTATNNAGCTASQTISIEVIDDYKVDATNILTPNGDGINDRFVIKNIDSYPNNELKIFDRVGRLIYNKRSYLNEWDGTLSGRPLQEGTYYYILDFGPGLPKVKGFITIIRDKY
ncbi:gliding motility-associated C-terminal domain-containing protein [Chitinophaga pendula]|uniref:T9SS type B sorting domain-containing protein n=1 Tax=Chitinophaga TaxID=79328 RepID=UPI0018DFFA1F|nr:MULTISPECIES: gliding motility-associated C-terminal domain-containing protein [Chitinophaga]UCJ06662.1 gliding motility-associated C-terminal domain-containing protein [Chitinophaga pendula]